MSDEGRSVKQEPRLVQWNLLLNEWQDECERRHRAREEGRPLGPATGIDELDSALGGWLMPGLHVIQGSAGTGKSAIAYQIAATCGTPSLFLSCEMQPLVLLERLIARVTQTPLSKIQGGALLPDIALSLARRAISASSNMSILDATEANAPLEFIEAAAARRRRDSEHLLIVVDSLHTWVQREYGAMGEYEALNEGLDKLGQMARRVECPVLCICEVNRASEKGGGGLGSGAGSRKIDYSPESVWHIITPEQPVASGGAEREVSLRLVKNRRGIPGWVVRLNWNGSLQRWSSA